MARQTINIGTNADDGTGDTLRDALDKVNDNFIEIYGELGGDTPSGIRLTGTTITTDATNANLTLDPNGTGQVIITGNSTTSGDVTVSGNLTVAGTSSLAVTTVSSTLAVTGATTLNSTLAVTGTSTFTGLLNAAGNVDLGDSTGDTVTVTGRFDSALVPSVTATNDLGTSGLRWGTVYATNVDVTGNITLGGNLTGGDADTDSITVNAEFVSDLVPDAASSYDIGSSGKTWATVYADTFSGALTGNVTGNVTGDVTGNITSTGTSTFSSIDVNGGAIDGTPIGASLPSTGSFTTLTIGNLSATLNTISSTSGDIILNSTGNVSVANNRITQVATPTAGSDAVNKTYVDTLISTGFNIVDDGSTSTVISGSDTLAVLGGTGIQTSLSGDTLTISSTDTLTTVLQRGATTVQAATFNGGITASSLTVDSININQNNISTNVTNADLVLDPSGTGRVQVTGDRLRITSTYTPATNVGAAGDRAGDIAYDTGYIYVCTADYDGSTVIWKRVAIGDSW